MHVCESNKGAMEGAAGGDSKLLKWSLKMFCDVVTAGLAIEGGDVELGDALIGAVKGEASAFEVTWILFWEGC